MWYHYLLIAVGLYFVATRILYVTTNKYSFDKVGWVFWSIPLVIGLGALYWGVTGLMTPAAPPMMGGRRRRY